MVGNKSNTVCIPVGASTQNRFAYVYWIEMKFTLWEIRMIIWNKSRILDICRSSQDKPAEFP